VVLSAPFAILFNHLSVFLVSEVLEGYMYLTATPDKKDVALREFQRRSKRHFNIMTSSVVFGTIGYSVGTLIFPGRGTVIVGAIFEMISYLI
jgi:hypothetical protein